MEEIKSKKVVVCGGGVIGVCTAFFLSRKGAAVTLVEETAIACAASGKAGGFLALDWCDDGPLGHLARASFHLHRTLADELNGPTSYGYRPLSAFSLTLTDSDQSKPVSRKKDTAPSWVDGPYRSVKQIGSTETTAQVHPRFFTQKLLDTAVESYGVEVTIAKVEAIEVDPVTKRVASVVLSTGKRISADAVVLALGPWSGQMSMLSEFEVYGQKAHSIVVEAEESSAITGDALFVKYDCGKGEESEAEVYPRSTGEVYLCGESKRDTVPENAGEVAVEEEAVGLLKRVAGAVSRKLGAVIVEQACFLPYTDDGLPLIGELDGVGGCYVATGHGCWGILNGPATGAAVAELVLHGRSEILDLSVFSPARFLNKSSKG